MKSAKCLLNVSNISLKNLGKALFSFLFSELHLYHCADTISIIGLVERVILRDGLYHCHEEDDD